MLKSKPISEVTSLNGIGLCCFIRVKILALSSSWHAVKEASCRPGVGVKTRDDRQQSPQ